MSSSLLRSASPNVRVDDDVWDMIFPDAKTTKNKKAAGDTAQTPDPITAKDIDIRDWYFTDRKKLESEDNRIKVFIDAELITTISKPLFRATSTKTGELLVNDTTILLAAVDADAVSRLIKYLEDIIANPGMLPPFVLCLPLTISLDVCAAASALGMDKYVDDLYAQCEDLLKTSLPSWATIDAITSYATTTPHFSRLFRIMINSLASRVWNETASNVEVFQIQLTPVFDKAIKRANEKYRTLSQRRVMYERHERFSRRMVAAGYGEWDWGRKVVGKKDEAGVEWDEYHGPARRSHV
ncbi:uncharacterized protein J4E84_006726 [Alternaria hordeiaustralica]|uniref:uncharacterized protein n=1 Tax=Alternaria hordeiaustralica TaxID=1187925 RepID=UPI0020C37209|nr:uncharacterized protein J4E84_006726 [Alternaria hordeiaustralica]KAI4683886.1 hypothetical protein J4E84_006726 [Alternaria hordeiaustralica]